MPLYTFPSIASGTRLTSTVMQALETQYILKGTTTSRVNNTFLDDPDLTFPVVANGIYVIEFFLYFSGAAGTAVGNFQTQWNVPSGSAGLKGVTGPQTDTAGTAFSNADNITVRMGVHGYGTSIPYGAVRNSASLFQQAVENSVITIGATPGNVTIQWAQQTTNAGVATELSSSSWARCFRIA